MGIKIKLSDYVAEYIAKKKVKILKKDTLKELEKKVLKEENKFYPIILEKLIRS